MLRVRLKQPSGITFAGADKKGYYEARRLNATKFLLCAGYDEYNTLDCNAIVDIDQIEDMICPENEL